MSKQQKQLSERRHKMAYRFLVKQFPDCKVTYDGAQGIDCFITHNNITIPIEIKTCKRLVKNNLIRIKEHPILYSKYTIGRFVFNSFQQEELLRQNGWYVFMVGDAITFGVKASELDIKNVSHYRVSWIKVMVKAFPDWVERLRKDVNDVKSPLERLWNNKEERLDKVCEI
jgi:hypothetical protein